MSICTPETVDIHKLLDGNTIFVVPKYQRSYSWKDDKVSDLFDDLLENHKAHDRKPYLLGPVVTVLKNGKREIIDGQQRLVTLTLWFCAMRDYLKTHGPPKKNVTYDNFLTKINTSVHPKNGKPLITLNNIEDTEDLKTICNETEKNRKRYSNIYTNYDTLYKDTQTEFEKLLKDDYDAGITKIVNLFENISQYTSVIHIKVDDEGYSYQIFQSLNSKGQPLKQSDLIKSRFMELCDNDTRNVIDYKWTEMMNSKSIKKDPDDFLFYSMLSHEDAGNIQKNNMYGDIKNKIKTQQDVEKYVDRLKDDAEIYEVMKQPKNIFHVKISSEKQIQYMHVLYAANQIKAKYFLRIQMAAYRIWGPENNDTLKLFDCLVKFFFMYRTIAKKDIDLLKSIAGKATDAICKTGKNNNLSEILRIILLNENNSNNIDQKYFEELLKEKVNNLDSNCISYMLYSFEYYLLNKCGQIPTTPTNYELEHIFPKKPTKKSWSNMDDLIDSKNSLGNITLLSPNWNNAIKNWSYQDKRTKGDKCYALSGLKINIKYLREYETWNMTSITKRQSKLVKDASEIWNLKTYLEIIGNKKKK